MLSPIPRIDYVITNTHTHTQKDASFHSCDQTGFSKHNSPQCETCRRWRLSSLHLKNDGRRHDSMSFSTGSECTEKLSTSTQTLAKSNQITQDGEKILSPQLKISPPLFLCFHEHHPPHPPTLPKNMSFAFIFHFFFNSPRSQLCESPSFTPFFCIYDERHHLCTVKTNI